ncbi:MAG: hypothetical protein H0W78_05735 [Planctomycetes bacterium]|jgi:hypothetical protein|nr:hypothetical protein [Planctomycetota bacterium]
MDRDRLLDLIDHPAPDPDTPRNPVLTHQVMERVRHAHAQAQVTTQAPSSDVRPWLMGALLIALIALVTPITGLVSDGGLGEAASLFDGDLIVELVIGSLIAVTALALSWRRLA